MAATPSSRPGTRTGSSLARERREAEKLNASPIQAGSHDVTAHGIEVTPPFRHEEFVMSTMDTSANANGRGSEAWSQSWTHLSIDRRSPSYCRVTFDHPPINTITAATVAELAELVGLVEQDPDLNVIVFDSANPEFYLAHYDIENDPGRTAALGVGPTGMPAWIDLLARLARAPVVTIASIRGRARGAGKRIHTRLRPAVCLPREHPTRPVRGRHRRRPGRRPDGPALPPGRSRPSARDPARRRRSRRASRRAVRLRQPGDRRRRARRRSRRRSPSG